VVLLDHDSTYPPLLAWYEDCPYEVQRLGNHGCYGFWRRRQHLLEVGWYAVTDCDLDLSGVPDDLLTVAQGSFQANPWAAKVGVSLEIADVPPESLARDCMAAYEPNYWQTRTDDGHWKAGVGATFALYHAERNELVDRDFYAAVRLDRPYTARHLPWYVIPGPVTEELDHYFSRCDGLPVYTNYIKRERTKQTLVTEETK
jgi:hypothetical protein